MYTDLKWKIPLILFAILGSAYLAYPLKDKIALGLDLQGGMHLVLEVQTEKAVEASLERIADDIKREIEEEDYEVDRVRADIENKTITVLMVDAIDLKPVEEIMKNHTAYLQNEGVVREGRGYLFRLSEEEETRIEQNAVSQGLILSRQHPFLSPSTPDHFFSQKFFQPGNSKSQQKYHKEKSLHKGCVTFLFLSESSHYKILCNCRLAGLVHF